MYNNYEIEVYRYGGSDHPFIIDKQYVFALYTRCEGKYPNTRYFTTYKPLYVGKYIRTERVGYGDGAKCYEVFSMKTIELDYDGKSCFKEWQ